MPPDDSQKIVSNALSLEEARRQLEKLEARLCASEARFRALVESTSDWIWETDADFVCTYSNPKIRDVLGYTREEVLGHAQLDFILVKDPGFLSEFRAARETGLPFHQIKLIGRHKTGRHIVLEISGVPILARDGALQGWRGIARDVTRKAEEAQQQQMLEDVINQNDALVVVWRMEPNKWPIEFISGNIANILGYTGDDFLSGRVSWPGITHQEDNPRLEKEVAEHLTRGDRKWSQEYRLITKSGEVRWFHDNNLAFTDSTGRIVKIQAVIYDITERRKIEEECRVISNRIMQAREEEKRRLSTDLHNAIGAMVVGLSSSLIIAQEELRHGSAGNANAKLAQTKKLLKEIAAMMKQVCVDIRPPALEISGLAGALAELISRVGGCSKIKISHRINLPDDWEQNHERAGIVIYRLAQEALSNAVKHSRAKNLEIVINYDNKKVMLSISDDGCGFETDKGESERSTLGLKIMREQVESIGGGLLIDSKPGRGTAIKAKFPL